MQTAAIRCMIVDDSETDRMMMERVLGKQQMRLDLLFAQTLGEARNLMREDGIKFIFLDNTLPDGCGADFLMEMQEYRKRNRASVVLVSDWPSPFMYAKAEAQNVRAIWNKCDFTISAVRRVLRERMAADPLQYVN